MANAPLPLDSVSRLPAPGDNVAIAIRRLDVGEVLAFADEPRVLAHTILEGHRFAARPIAPGELLLSWGLPFGRALRPIAPGDYVSNAAMLAGLAVRRVEGLHLPAQANFEDVLDHFQLDERTLRPAPPVPPAPSPRTFAGFRRPGRRGVGTRNTVVILGTTSRTASFARQLTARLQALARVHPTIDGIVAIAHTEGGGTGEPNNTAEILRALAGFIVHPNVGAVLAIDYGVEPITNERLRAFMHANDYALDDVPHHFLTLSRGLAAGLAEGEQIVRAWLPAVAACTRTDEPLSGLKIALQCGGSDAFSGVSGNPLAGALVHEAIRHGATGVLTETDESMGAEGYMLKNVRDVATARAFIGTLDAFREKLAWHGLTPESNPSAGNRFRGLYNIALKSLGAVHKKDPRTRLDHVIAYAQPLVEPGFTFMNGPGNDLEGIAGQVGAGCNLILFVTGNGSITNFPFAPTLKITTTTRRHTLLIREMDINAGRYLDGEPMESVAADAFEVLVATASGRKTRGEHAGHSQVSLWRNWRQTDTSQLPALRARVAPDGQPLQRAGAAESTSPALTHSAPATLSLVAASGGRFATERIGLVLPTSLCATQIARLAAERLNAKQAGAAHGISRFVAFTHTEGCGFGGETMYQLLQRTYRGYLTHPNVAAALLLEHGCEKVPNDVMRQQLDLAGIPLTQFGWASVQLDGGIDKAIANIERWFAEKLGPTSPLPSVTVDLGAITLGLMTAAPVTDATADALAALTKAIVRAGGSVLQPESDPLLANPRYVGAVFGTTPLHATLAYGEPLQRPGLHLVASETDHWVENLTGLGGCGAHLALTLVSGHPQQGHPMLPVIQLAETQQRGRLPADDIDGFLSGDAATDYATLVRTVAAVAQHEWIPVSMAQGFVDFQLTRGLLGLTT
ncbi:UxaA family hydrolase [Horticoccus sp. 23ND18S-11]|uniref:UxaA family hydrolase n=1 Tax=Horticoccus sp. 23ND18S-11 TaxID=3391832 RepID=UPI0039C9B767